MPPARRSVSETPAPPRWGHLSTSPTRAAARNPVGAGVWPHGRYLGRRVEATRNRYRTASGLASRRHPDSEGPLSSVRVHEPGDRSNIARYNAGLAMALAN